MPSGWPDAPSPLPSDLTDAQWELIEPLLPEPNTGGRPEQHPRREIVNAVLYMVRSGCPWRYLPTDLPPWQTVYWYFQQWGQAGVTETLLAELRVKARRQAGLDDEPSAGISDSQGVKGADTVGRDSAAMTRARRSTAVRGSSSPTPAACWLRSRCWPQACRIATAPRRPCCRRT
ncbi:IS5 family transposase [Nonomuraea sp. SYSU D8015]|uniref:IS5 family transposase n=1 Tax=Nonomuraea sp. SYSU D8015 TaxID=2593644 RepID=UPI0016607D6C|nr:IS5 family transposase [Nonomuraea sp. SYSU D8015]